MALTNLTFADGANKALLCSMLPALQALVAQLSSRSEELCQVAASVIRNLSWHSDLASKRALRDVEAAMALVRSAMAECRRETTLKSVLSALWNLSSHSPDNKADICCVPGALEFLVNLLSYRSPSKTLSVVENAGGILRNVSSHVAVRDDYRVVLRRAGCLQTLLRHLRSPSLTVVSNACGTLWNLSARCAEDQSTLLQLGAVAMLKNLVHSRHRMISMGSAAALKNLLTAAANLSCVSSERSLLHDTPLSRCDSAAVPPSTVGLHVRRQRAFEEDLNRRQLSETCDDMDSPVTSPTSTLRSIVDVRSNSACFMSDVGSTARRRIQSPSPLRLSDRPTITPLLYHRSSSHTGMLTSHSSDEISAWDRGRTPGLVNRTRRPTDWSSMSAASRDNGEVPALCAVNTAQMMSSFTGQSVLESPKSPVLFNDFVHTGMGSRRFLKSRVTRKLSTEPSAAMCASFLSERTENIHLDDLELKSSCDFDDARGGSGSQFYSQSASVDSAIDNQKSTNRLSDLSTDLPHAVAELPVSLADESAAAADREDKSLCTADETSQNDIDVELSVPDVDVTRSLNQSVQLLPPTNCTFSSDAPDVTNSCSMNCQLPMVATDLNDTGGTDTSADIVNLQHGINGVRLGNDIALSMNISTHSDVVSDIMEESFPNLTLSTNSDLQSSTDLLVTDQLPAITVDSLGETVEDLDSTNKEQTNCVPVNEVMFEPGAESGDSSDVLCYNSAELMSLLEVNANRVLRELELRTADSSSSSEVRLLEDETISLVSGNNDYELDFDDDDDDDDDDDYIDAISSRTYDISSASGEAAALSSRHCSSRSSSSGSDSRHSSPPAAPVKIPGRPRIVKPSDIVERRQNEQSTAGEAKSVRGRRKALYSTTKPKIPPASQSTSSADKSRPATVDSPTGRRPSSANTASRKPAVVRPVTKPTSVNNKTAKTAPKRVMSAPNTTVSGATSRQKQAQQSAALKKPPTTTQTNAVDSKVKRRSDVSHTRTESAASSKSTASQSRPSSSNQSITANNKNERPTAPIKQATFVKADQSVEEIRNNSDGTVTQTDKSSASLASATERPALVTATRDRQRPSSASSVRSNRPPVSAKPTQPVRASASSTAAAAACRFTAASKVGLRHSSPSSVRTGTANVNSTVRAPQPSLPVTTKSQSSSSSSSSAAAAVSTSSTARGMKPVGASSPARKPISSQPQSPAKSSVEASKKPCQSAGPANAGSMMTRTSTYDKQLHDADKLQNAVERTLNSDVQSPSANVDSANYEKSSEPQVASPTDSNDTVVSGRLSEEVIRRARQMVEQADQIQTRYVSPPQSIRFSNSIQLPDEVIQRPTERQLNALPQITDTCQSIVAPTESLTDVEPTAVVEHVDERAASQTQSGTNASQPSSLTVDKPKPSPIRKFGFIGLWRRQRPQQPAAATAASTEREKQEDTRSNNTSDTTSPRPRKTFSWWRRTASPAGTAGNTASSEASTNKSAGRVFDRGTARTDASRPRSPSCRAAVVTPFNYRPTQPSLFADLPQSHQTKTAMLIERRMRRLKMASESASDQMSDCCKSKSEVTSRRKNLLVTTV